MGGVINKLLLLFTLVLFSCQIPFGERASVGSRSLSSESSPQEYEHRISSTITPKQSIDSLNVEYGTEKMVKLSHARVLLADYDLLKKDFPILQNLSDPEIDNWLVNEVGYISMPQAEQTVVNSSVPVEETYREAYRPRRYNRASIFDVSNPKNPSEKVGIIDVKGTGSLSPAQKDHGNGVASLGEVIREFIYERAMREVVYDAGIENKIVGSYAVIDPGFDVVHEDGSKSPAGYYLRQGHDRWVAQNAARNDWLDQQDRLDLQKIFRAYGIDPKDNIQGTKDKHIFDFGHFVVSDNLIESDDSKKLPFEVWGYDKNLKASSSDRWFYSKHDNPWKWSHELADAWRDGRANRHDVWQHYENLIRPFVNKISSQNIADPRACSDTVKKFFK